jgi:predicted hydrocarbon binding protein
MLSSTAHDFIEACGESGCPACRLEQAYVKRYLDNLFYESVNDIDLRKTLRGNLGFCAEHGWLAATQKRPYRLGLAIIYKDVLINVMRQLKKEAGSTNPEWEKSSAVVPSRRVTWVDRIIRSITPRGRCPACHQQAAIHKSIAETVGEKVVSQQMLTAIRSSAGLCMPHLRGVLKASRDSHFCEALVGIQLEKYAVIHQDLEEIIRKSDYRFVDEGLGKEADAWLRALGIVAGRRDQ